MKNKVSLIKLFCLIFICMGLFFSSKVEATSLSSNELLKFKDYTITKTTKIEDITNYFGEPKVVGDSAFGGIICSYYDDSYTWYLCVETDSLGTIKGYGCIFGDFIAKNYAIGDVFSSTYSRLSGYVIYDDDNKVYGTYEYNCNTAEANNYVNNLKGDSQYLYDLQKHAVIVSKVLAKINDYSFPQTYINEDIFYRNEQLKANGTDLNSYAKATGKTKYLSTIISTTITDFYAYLPSPIMLATYTRNYTRADNYTYVFYDLNLSESSYHKLTIIFVDPEFLNEKDEIALTDTELNLLEAVKEQYAQYNEHGQSIIKNFDITPVYKELPLVAGKWTEPALLMVTDYLNIARAGLGIQTVTLNMDIADCAQHKAALVAYNRYNGYESGHYPAQPEGVSDEFYNKAQSYMNENLYTGDIQTSIVGALNDGYGDPVTCGHRYNLLDPSFTQWGVGAVGSGISYGWQGVHKMSGSCNYTNELVAWPSNGIFPIDLAYNGIGNWTALFYKNYRVSSNSTVTVKNLSSNKTYQITSSRTNKLLKVTGKYLITFRDDSITYESGDVFEITIHNVENIATSEVTDYTYRSVFLSLSQIGGVEAQDIQTSTNTVYLAVGRTKKVDSTVIPEDTTDKLMNIYSEDPQIATVRQDGLITAVSLGKTRIHFVCSNIDKIVEVSVEEFLKGDVNTDGYINSTDAALVLDRFKNNDATEADYKLGDMNEDNMLNSTDAAMILDIYKAM